MLSIDKPSGMATAVHTMRSRSPRALLLLVLLACVTLAACGSSNHAASTSSSATAAAAATPTATTPTAPPTATAPTASTPGTEAEQKSATFQHQRRALVAVVHCMHQHGYQLPEPDSKNHVNFHGFPVESQHYQTAAASCLRLLQTVK